MNRLPVSKFEPRLGKLFSFGKNADGLLSIGLDIPLVPFDSGLAHVTQPERTFFDLHVFLPAEDVASLAGRSFDSPEADQDGTIYLGSTHNPVDVERVYFHKRIGARFDVELVLFCKFSFEGVAEDERVTLKAKVVCEKLLFASQQQRT